MKITYYNDFLHYLSQGFKKQATGLLRLFINSFENETEIKNWVWEYLPFLETNHQSRIRHEIFIELIYPVLKAGYLDNDFDSTLWLGKLIQNIYQTQNLYEELGCITENQLFRKCYGLKPDNQEIRRLLLYSIIQSLQYSIHEWPLGILYENDEATMEQVKEIQKEVEFAEKLDVEKHYDSFLTDFKIKMEINSKN